MKFYKSKLLVNESNYMNVGVINFGSDDLFGDNDSSEISDSPIHHIQIIDRSGSMTSDIDRLIENVKETIADMKPSDYFSVIWFSGENQFRTIIKGASASSDIHDYFKVLDSIKNTIGLTCFNQATKEAIEISNELENLCDTVSITLFTDGMSTTQGDNTKMIGLINEIVNKYNNKIIAFNTIGYGNYCDETLLSFWSGRTQYGIFTHQSKIDQYHAIFNSNKETVEETFNNPLNIDINDGSVKMYYSTNSFTRKINESHFEYSRCPSRNQIILISENSFDDVVITINGIEYEMSDVKYELNSNWIDGIFYKVAYSEYANGNVRDSLKWLEILGDKSLIDSHMNSYNNLEKSHHVKLLKDACRYTKYRNPGTAPKNYIPDQNTPCVIDLISILAMNKCIYYNEYTDYVRIGRKVEDKFNMFRSYDDNAGEIVDIVFNEERLNVSLKFKINGFVSINPRQAKEVGLDSIFKCSIFRTHTIVKDGNLNVESIYVKITNEAVYDYVIETFKNAINKEIGDGIICIDLTKIPIVNNHYKNLTIHQIYELTKDTIIAKSYLKVVKYLISKIDHDDKSYDHAYTDEQKKLLNEYSIKNGIYYGIDNKIPKVDECDFYVTRTMKFYIKGFSSSSVLSPVANLLSGKSKKSDKYMIEALEKYQSEDDLNELRIVEKALKTRIIENSKTVSACKIAVILTGDFFEDVFPTSKDDVLYYDPENGDILNIKMGYDREYFTA